MDDIIHRDLQEVRAIFEGGGCAAIKTIRADIGDTWFVSFETESDAVETLFVIRERSFRNEKVRAGIKSENLLRPTYVTQRSADRRWVGWGAARDMGWPWGVSGSAPAFPCLRV